MGQLFVVHQDHLLNPEREVTVTLQKPMCLHLAVSVPKSLYALKFQQYFDDVIFDDCDMSTWIAWVKEVHQDLSFNGYIGRKGSGPLIFLDFHSGPGQWLGWRWNLRVHWPGLFLPQDCLLRSVQLDSAVEFDGGPGHFFWQVEVEAKVEACREAIGYQGFVSCCGTSLDSQRVFSVAIGVVRKRWRVDDGVWWCRDVYILDPLSLEAGKLNSVPFDLRDCLRWDSNSETCSRFNSPFSDDGLEICYAASAYL